MTNVSDNVRVAVTGAVSVGGDTFVAPTSAEGALTGATDLGYISDEGVTEARARDINDITAWQNGDVVRRVVTSASMSYRCVFLEAKREVVEEYYAGEVNTADGSIIVVPGKLSARKPWVFDYVDGDIAVRAYAPSGQVTEIGDQVWVNGEPVGYDVTVTCYPSSAITDGDGNSGSVKKFFSNLVEESSSSSSSSSSS